MRLWYGMKCAVLMNVKDLDLELKFPDSNNAKRYMGQVSVYEPLLQSISIVNGGRYSETGTKPQMA